MKLNQDQLLMQKMLIKKFKKTIYTKHGEINLRATKQIALAAGLENPFIYVSTDLNALIINCEVIDPYGTPIGEIKSIYSFCLWLKSLNY